VRSLFLGFILAFAGCTVADTDSGPSGDADTDADSDSDSDADSDADVEPNQVVLAFSGIVATVTDSPLGLDYQAVGGSSVTGTLTYDLNVADRNDDPTDGIYDHLGGNGGFTCAIGGHTITGSGKPITEFQDASWGDVFRFNDGPQNDDVIRTMKVDGTDYPTMTTWVSITNSGDWLTSEDQPNPFPSPDFSGFDFPHTFSIDTNDQGGFLLQLDSLVQTSP